MDTFKLGKTPARPGAVKFKLSDYIPLSALPVAPAVFGTTVDPGNFAMLGNDTAGDCVWAGADHEHMAWNSAAGKTVSFTTENAFADYSAVTGFDPNKTDAQGNNPTDQGTDMEQAAAYRRKTGIIDASGVRHRVGAYVAIPGVSTKGNNSATFLDTLANSAFAFEAVGIGIEFPASAMDQFNQGKPWDVVDGSPIEGGHYVPLVGRRANGNFVVITWGALQEVTRAFLVKYVDEAIVYLTTEFLNSSGLSREGFDIAGLNRDIASLGGTPIDVPPAPVPVPTTIPPFPLAEVLPWLNSRCYTLKSKAAQKAIKAWLAAGGQ